MHQTNRDHAVTEWINQLITGIPSPNDFHHGARVYFPSAINTAKPGSCLVCNATLIGKQDQFCHGHWDYVFVPKANLASSETLVEFIELNLRLTFVEITRQDWNLVTKGHSRCEICNTPTDNVEELRSGLGHTLKRHVVCPDHQSFRSVE